VQRLLMPCVGLGLGLGFYSRYKHAAGSLTSRGGQCTLMSSSRLRNLLVCLLKEGENRGALFFPLLRRGHVRHSWADSLLHECSVLRTVMMKGFAATLLMEWFCSLSGM
jgi:hypothetical protein